MQLYPFRIPDLSSGSPLFISGRYQGEFPESLKASGTLADMSKFMMDLKLQKAKEIPLDRVILHFCDLWIGNVAFFLLIKMISFIL